MADLSDTEESSISGFIKDLFKLENDIDEEKGIENIIQSVYFRGANLWTLVCAIFIASIGLNINSNPVVIGAMLISPLMGPIIGSGLALGVNDQEFLKRSLRNLALAVLVALLTSTLYFLITPIHEAQSELLARTRPTIFDVLIAIFGGVAGIIALMRRESTNALPGVAISTALMPPLCTAGFGLATNSFHYFFGAFYLFSINCIFIFLSTFAVVRYLGLQKIKNMAEKKEKRINFFIALTALVTTIPAGYTAYDLVQEGLFKKEANSFIEKNFNLTEHQIINTKITYGNKPVIEITMLGDPIEGEHLAKLEDKIKEMRFSNTNLVLHGPKQNTIALKKQFAEYNHDLKTEILKELVTKNEEVINNKEREIVHLKTEIENYKESDAIGFTQEEGPKILQELNLYHPEIKSLILGGGFSSEEIGKKQAVIIVFLKKTLRKKEREKVTSFLKQRLNKEDLMVIFED